MNICLCSWIEISIRASPWKSCVCLCVYVCMYCIYIYIYIYIYIHTHTHIHIHVPLNVQHIFIYIYTYTCSRFMLRGLYEKPLSVLTVFPETRLQKIRLCSRKPCTCSRFSLLVFNKVYAPAGEHFLMGNIESPFILCIYIYIYILTQHTYNIGSHLLCYIHLYIYIYIYIDIHTHTLTHSLTHTQYWQSPPMLYTYIHI
jgi:hypothetical protein